MRADDLARLLEEIDRLIREGITFGPSDTDATVRQGQAANGRCVPNERQVITYPFLGGYLACLDVLDAGPMQFERTTRSRGHFTLWGEPAVLLACVVATIPVARVR